MPKRNKYDAYKLGEVHSELINAVRVIQKWGCTFPSDQQIAQQINVDRQYKITPEEVDHLLRGLLYYLQKPEPDDNDFDDRKRKFFKNFKENKYLLVTGQDSTRPIPAFATEDTGMEVLQSIVDNPYRNTIEIAQSCNVSQETVYYHIRRAARLLGLSGKYLQFQIRDLINNGQVVFFKRGTYDRKN